MVLMCLAVGVHLGNLNMTYDMCNPADVLGSQRIVILFLCLFGRLERWEGLLCALVGSEHELSLLALGCLGAGLGASYDTLLSSFLFGF